MVEPAPKQTAKHSDNPAARIVAHNTSLAQRDVITTSRVKLHAATGSVAVEDVGGLLDDAVATGDLEEVAEDVYRVAE